MFPAGLLLLLPYDQPGIEWKSISYGLLGQISVRPRLRGTLSARLRLQGTIFSKLRMRGVVGQIAP